MAHNFLPSIPNAGFDNTARPAWQMVPLGGWRKLTLTGLSSRTIVACDRPDILRVRMAAKGANIQLTMTGIREGTTLVEFLPPPTSAKIAPATISLAVSVKKRKEVKTTFFYVRDNYGHATARSLADLNGLIERANRILTPQANVAIKRKNASILVMPQDINLGDVVRKRLKSSPDFATEDEFNDLKKHRDSKADVTLFFVHEWEHDDTPLIDNTAATTYWRKGSYKKKKMIMFEDKVPNDAITLAHEIIHALGIHRHTSAKNNLNTKSSIRTGTFIPKDQVNRINE